MQHSFLHISYHSSERDAEISANSFTSFALSLECFVHICVKQKKMCWQMNVKHAYMVETVAHNKKNETKGTSRYVMTWVVTACLAHF